MLFVLIIPVVKYYHGFLEELFLQCFHCFCKTLPESEYKIFGLLYIDLCRYNKDYFACFQNKTFFFQQLFLNIGFEKKILGICMLLRFQDKLDNILTFFYTMDILIMIRM